MSLEMMYSQRFVKKIKEYPHDVVTKIERTIGLIESGELHNYQVFSKFKNKNIYKARVSNDLFVIFTIESECYRIADVVSQRETHGLMRSDK